VTWGETWGNTPFSAFTSTLLKLYWTLGIPVKNLCAYILMLVELLWQLWVEIVIFPLFGIVLLQAIDTGFDIFALES
jgi:hypothetical protein